MGGDNYVIDDNGAWSNPSAALEWYRTELKRMREGYALILSRPESDARCIAEFVVASQNKSSDKMCRVIHHAS